MTDLAYVLRRIIDGFITVICQHVSYFGEFVSQCGLDFSSYFFDNEGRESDYAILFLLKCELFI